MSGYLGQFHRRAIKLKPITRGELILIMFKNNKLAEMFRIIYSIDQSRNGFVTQTELDDILKILYKDELADKDLKPLIKPFCCISNKILVDYKKFRDYILQEFKELKQDF